MELVDARRKRLARYTGLRHSACWLDTAARHLQSSRMQRIELTDDEMQDAAQASRIASVQAEEDAKKQSNPGVRAIFDNTARRYRELATKFERARISRDSQ